MADLRERNKYLEPGLIWSSGPEPYTYGYVKNLSEVGWEEIMERDGGHGQKEQAFAI